MQFKILSTDFQAQLNSKMTTKKCTSRQYFSDDCILEEPGSEVFTCRRVSAAADLASRDRKELVTRREEKFYADGTPGREHQKADLVENVQGRRVRRTRPPLERQRVVPSEEGRIGGCPQANIAQNGDSMSRGVMHCRVEQRHSTTSADFDPKMLKRTSLKQHSASCPSLIIGGPGELLSLVRGSSIHSRHLYRINNVNNDSDFTDGSLHKSMLNLTIIDGGPTSTSSISHLSSSGSGQPILSTPGADDTHRAGGLRPGPGCSDEGSGAAEPHGGVQICINDVTVENPEDAEDDDLNLEAIKKQKRRSSWCPEKERKKDEKEEKQRMLGVGGRSQSLSSLEGQDDDSDEDEDSGDESATSEYDEDQGGAGDRVIVTGRGPSNDPTLEKSSPYLSPSCMPSSTLGKNFYDHSDSLSHERYLSTGSRDNNRQIGYSGGTLGISCHGTTSGSNRWQNSSTTLTASTGSRSMDKCRVVGDREYNTKPNRRMSVTEITNELNRISHLEEVHKFANKDNKTSRRGSVLAKINSYRQKRNTKAIKSTHQFVSVSFSNSTACDVCTKTLSNKPALQCENCSLNVHEVSCKDQAMPCPKTCKNHLLTSNVSLREQRRCSLQDATPVGLLKNAALARAGHGRVMGQMSTDETVLHKQNTQSSEDSRDSSDGRLLTSITNYLSTSNDSLDDANQLSGSGYMTVDPAHQALAMEFEEEGDYLLRQIDLEAWSVTVDKKAVKKMNSRDIKRQDHIWEFIQTEKNHYRNLKMMQKIFAQGLLKEVGLSREKIDQIFPRLDDLFDIHQTFLSRLVKRQSVRIDQSIEDIGDILIQQFDGWMSGRMKSAYGEFCSRHTESVNLYKELQRTDRKFQQFVNRCSLNSLCRRLDVPAVILLVTQRITKYPLLIEPIIKTTRDTKLQEKEMLNRAQGLVKDIIQSVNRQIDAREKELRLAEIYERLDPKSMATYRGNKLKKSDLMTSNRKLHHDGLIKWTSARGKQVEVLAVILSDMMFFLNDGNQRYTFFTQDNKSSIVSLSKLLVREKDDTKDSRGIYLICSNRNEPEMYELVCKSIEERKQWISILRDAVSKCTKEELVGSQAFDENEYLKEAETTKLQQLVGELKRKDQIILTACNDKWKIAQELLETIGKHDQAVVRRPSTAGSDPLDITQLLQSILNQETSLLESLPQLNYITLKAQGALQQSDLQTTSALILHSVAAVSQASTVDSPSSVSSIHSIESSSASELSLALPKRADTFSGFDASDRTSPSSSRRRNASGALDEKGQRVSSLLSLSEEPSRLCMSSALVASTVVAQTTVAAVRCTDSPVRFSCGGDNQSEDLSPTTGSELSLKYKPLDMSGKTCAEICNIVTSSAAGLESTESAVVQIVQLIHSLITITAQKGTELETLKVQLSEAKEKLSALSVENEKQSHERRIAYHPDKQLEELRHLQGIVQQERSELQHAKERQAAEVESGKQDLEHLHASLDKQKMDMKSEKDELQRQREALQRQIDLFEEQKSAFRQYQASLAHQISGNRPSPDTISSGGTMRTHNGSGCDSPVPSRRVPPPLPVRSHSPGSAASLAARLQHQGGSETWRREGGANTPPMRQTPPIVESPPYYSQSPPSRSGSMQSPGSNTPPYGQPSVEQSGLFGRNNEGWNDGRTVHRTGSSLVSERVVPHNLISTVNEDRITQQKSVSRPQQPSSKPLPSQNNPVVSDKPPVSSVPPARSQSAQALQSVPQQILPTKLAINSSSSTTLHRPSGTRSMTTSPLAGTQPIKTSVGKTLSEGPVSLHQSYHPGNSNFKDNASSKNSSRGHEGSEAPTSSTLGGLSFSMIGNLISGKLSSAHSNSSTSNSKSNENNSSSRNILPWKLAESSSKSKSSSSPPVSSTAGATGKSSSNSGNIQPGAGTAANRTDVSANRGTDNARSRLIDPQSTSSSSQQIRDSRTGDSTKNKEQDIIYF